MGSGVNVSAGGGVSVEVGTAVFISIRVLVGAGIVEFTSVTVLVYTGVEVISGVASPGVRVGCSASTGGSTIKTPTFSMAAPASSNVILT